MSKIQIKRFTLEERKKIERMLKMGMALTQIAKNLNRNHTSIRWEILTRSVNGSYNAIIAHKSVKGKSYKEVLEKSSKNKPLTTFIELETKVELETKIEALNMQIEILFEQLKELQNDKIHE